MYLLNLSWAKLKFLKNRQISITKQFNKTIIYPSNNKTYIVDSSSTIMAVHRFTLKLDHIWTVYPKKRSHLNCQLPPVHLYDETILCSYSIESLHLGEIVGHEFSSSKGSRFSLEWEEWLILTFITSKSWAFCKIYFENWSSPLQPS
jgi:hypothetical protein